MAADGLLARSKLEFPFVGRLLLHDFNFGKGVSAAGFEKDPTRTDPPVYAVDRYCWLFDLLVRRSFSGLALFFGTVWHRLLGGKLGTFGLSASTADPSASDRGCGSNALAPYVVPSPAATLSGKPSAGSRMLCACVPFIHRVFGKFHLQPLCVHTVLGR